MVKILTKLILNCNGKLIKTQNQKHNTKQIDFSAQINVLSNDNMVPCSDLEIA